MCATPEHRLNGLRAPARGFTMIELIVTLALLGILAAMAMPRFVNLRAEADDAAVNGLAGAAASGMAINYAACSVTAHDRTGPNAARCKKIDSCFDVGATMQDGWPANFEVVADTAIGSGSSNGDEVVCTLRRTGTTAPTATFVGISAGNP